MNVVRINGEQAVKDLDGLLDLPQFAAGHAEVVQDVGIVRLTGEVLCQSCSGDAAT